jgi:fructosamine-3-kinase
MLEPKRDDIEALARAAFGAKCRLLAWHPVDSRDGDLVIFATLVFPARVVVIKLADPQSPRPSLAREAAIQQRVARETRVPVCEVLAVDDSCQRFPWRYLMTAHAPGMDWRDGLTRMSPPARRDIFRQLGEAVAALHSLRYREFGEAEVEAHVPDLTPRPPLPQERGSQTHSAGRERSSSFLEALTARARRRIANPAHADLFANVLQARASDFADISEPRLTHEDLNPSNLLLVPGENEGGDWRMAALLDFESAWAGCPESDIARLELWRDMMGDGFYAGYTTIRPIAEGYPARRPVYQLLWCLEYARATPAHHADTARVCAALGVPAVTFAPQENAGR